MGPDGAARGPNARPAPTVIFERFAAFLAAAGRPTELLWVFDEHLAFCPETGIALRSDVPTVRPRDPETACFYLAEGRPLLLRALGTCRERTVCTLLCGDELVDLAGEHHYEPIDEWGVLFHAGHGVELAEVTDPGVWSELRGAGRVPGDLAFVLPLAAVREVERYGRCSPAWLRFLRLAGRTGKGLPGHKKGA